MNRNKIILLVTISFVVLCGLIAFISLSLNTTKKSEETTITVPDEQNTAQNLENAAGYINGVFVATSTLLAGEDISTSAIKYTVLPKDLFSENFTWQKPEEITKLGVIAQKYQTCPNDGMFEECPSFSENSSTYHRIAKFSYHQQNGEVILLLPYGGYYFVNFNNNLILLEKNSTQPAGNDGLIKPKFLVEKNLTLPKSTNTPKELTIEGKQKLYFMEEGATVEFMEDTEVGGIKNEKIAYFKNKDVWNFGDFFVTFTNNIQGIQPLKYNIRLPDFFNLDNGKVENVSFYDSKRDIGCGRHDGVKVLSEIKEDVQLKKIGTANDGNFIFRSKDSDAESSNESQMFLNYNGYMENTNSPTTTYEKFLASNPIIIMKDGFGRYVEFTKKEFIVSLAECGKPVIYLYPTKDTKVNVQIKPNGGLTKVDPFYPVDGWLVNAKPNGNLTNTDGQNYPYLFWEGNAYDMKVPTEGFVLKRENIRKNMTTLLARLGLNEKEVNDFLEFWQIKLEVKPYVFVTFVSQANFDKVAPLNITPKPDKIIRVFMDYQPLDISFKVKPLEIETPTRDGFTVVEWGGRLHQ